MGTRARRVTATTDGLAATFREAMRLWDAMKADGVSEPIRFAMLTKTLRAAWPFVRAWHYRCEACRDTGLVVAVCRRGSRCDGQSTRTGARRLCATHPESEYAHDYAIPCVCAPGAKFRRALQPPTAADFTHATKQRQPTRVGR